MTSQPGSTVFFELLGLWIPGYSFVSLILFHTTPSPTNRQAIARPYILKTGHSSSDVQLSTYVPSNTLTHSKLCHSFILKVLNTIFDFLHHTGS